MATIKTWNGTSFVYPDAKNADSIDNLDSSGFASANHQHLKSAITDFAHKSTHATGGTDALAPSDIGAVAVSGGTMTGKLSVPNMSIGADSDIYLYESATDALGLRTGPSTAYKYFTFAANGDFSVLNGEIYSGSNKVWHAGNFTPANYSLTTHNHTYNVNDNWLRFLNDSSWVKLYGNSRQMVLRTDGMTEYVSGVGNYPFVFMYGGDAAANRLAMIGSDGDLWTSKNGWMSAKISQTSTARPGVTKLYRNDNDSNYNVQVSYTGAYWQLRGYNADTFHAECYVAQAGNADTCDGQHLGTSNSPTFAGGTITGSLTVSSGNTTGGGIILADDGDIVDMNDGYCAMRFSSGVKVYSGNKTGSAVITLASSGTLTATKVYGAVYNDYAECRQSKEYIPYGSVAVEGTDGYIVKCTKRLAKSAMVVSDTYGFSIGEQKIEGELSTPIAVAGRALVYTDKDRDTFKPGDAVCSGKYGTVSKMTWWEKIIFPDRIIGVVSEIPDYTTWGTDNVQVNGRIWIRVK